MGKRSTARRLAMQVLFQLDAGQDDLTFLLEQSARRERLLPDTMQFAGELALGAREHLAELDKYIAEKSIGWALERIAGVDKAILRLAVYEIKFLQTPPSVAINEAVELAKKFSTAESAKFVNGILGGLAEK
ncbi:transcription termination/antitermination protein NusB [Candidatus Termititenax aidoneus]|uniref:Transcription antitermination protein NusB n=1 Tax=Termititenax aidoneus TaxID=2218524 RepID=A0A388TBP1_TERA1|nr:transcription termination/antitermination protein NusB [Candidatus Termititenax aidoneus]